MEYTQKGASFFGAASGSLPFPLRGASAKRRKLRLLARTRGSRVAESIPKTEAPVKVPLSLVQLQGLEPWAR